MTIDSTSCQKKIDSFCHFAFLDFFDMAEKYMGRTHPERALLSNNPSIHDPEYRLRVMDETGIDISVLTPLPELAPTPEVYENAKASAEISRFTNESMAELVSKYPTRFRGGARIPTTNQDVMVEEIDYAIGELGLVGMMIPAGPTVKSWDDEFWEPLWTKAEELDVPIWMHPSRPGGMPDYPFENGPSQYQFFQAYSWVYDDTLAMHRIVFGGVFERHPNVKIITHHHGAMIPYFAGRVDTGVAFFEKNMGFKYPTPIEAPFKDHYKKFYIDTATQSYNPQALALAIDYFGADHTLFGSDCPMDAENGRVMINGAIDSIADIGLDKAAEDKVYFENAQKMFKL